MASVFIQVLYDSTRVLLFNEVPVQFFDGTQVELPQSDFARTMVEPVSKSGLNAEQIDWIKAFANMADVVLVERSVLKQLERQQLRHLLPNFYELRYTDASRDLPAKQRVIACTW